jgi:hypothetical protein
MSAEKSELRWYLLSTKRGEEVLAKRALETACADVFLPLLYEARAGAKPQPLFPRRVFARVNLKSRLFDVAYKPGARDLVKAGDPIEVPDSLVAELKVVAREKKKGARDTAGVAVPDSVLKLFGSRTPSLERTVALMRIIEERRARKCSGQR